MIAVVTVNYNGWRDTLEAHASLQRSTYDDWCLVVVDNHSADESVARLSELRDRDDRVDLVAASTNSGFAGGVNLGVARARALGAESVLLLNNDAMVRPDTLQRLGEVAAALPNAVLGCVVRFTDSGELQFFGSGAVAGGFPSWYREPRDSARLADALIDTDFVFGAALFAPLALFDTVGGFDERYFLTFEETDWCYRVRAAGHRCLMVRDAVVDHRGSATMGAADSPLQAYFLQRNRLLFSEQHARRSTHLRLLARAMRDRTMDAWRARGRGRGRSRSAGGVEAARLRAVTDYVLRRFGDCPDSVRRSAARR